MSLGPKSIVIEGQGIQGREYQTILPAYKQSKADYNAMKFDSTSVLKALGLSEHDIEQKMEDAKEAVKPLLKF